MESIVVVDMDVVEGFDIEMRQAKATRHPQMTSSRPLTTRTPIQRDGILEKCKSTTMKRFLCLRVTSSIVDNYS